MSFLYFPEKNLPDRRLLPQFAKANNKIVKAIKKIALMFSKNIMRYSNVDFKKRIKNVCHGCQQYANYLYFSEFL